MAEGQILLAHSPQNIAHAVVDLLDGLESLINVMRTSQGFTDIYGRVRVNVDAGMLPAVTTVTTLTGQTNIGGLNAALQIPSALNTTVAAAIRSNITVS